MKAPSGRAVRCAIYTRVSTEYGLDQDFNSLDAQYDAASAYIKSQAHAGWTLIRSRYDDGGYSGGSTDRPDLQRLLDDIRSRKLDVIVVYKVDRLTRSLADFAKLVELFDAHGVSFVSVTQQFNTTTSMGRLTLNVLLSFAQFEREVTSERIRDKIAASKRKGLWVGGPLPLGYHMKGDKIAVVEDEAERVRLIYRRYLELGGVNALVRDLRKRDIRTKSRLLATGVTRGGILFGRGSLFYLLRNRFYIGEVKYKDEILDRHSLAATFGARISRWCCPQEARSQFGFRTDRQRPGLPHQGWKGFVCQHRGVTRCWRSVAAFGSRLKLPLRTRSRICAVSISKVFVHDGRAYFRNRRPIICRGICCSQSSSIGFKPTALAT